MVKPCHSRENGSPAIKNYVSHSHENGNSVGASRPRGCGDPDIKPTLVLGIESSCDETAAAVYCAERGILSSALHSQIDFHKCYGGVIPELASRSHLEKIDPIVQEALAKANVSLEDIDTIAVTSKPGLPGSLLIGLTFAKTLAWAAGKKLIGVNHLEGHVFSSFLEHDVPFPHLCLTASGGHTSLYRVDDFGDYTLLGTTHDDAAGEAFDKIAKLMGLAYPGGPVIEKIAASVEFQDFFSYPRTSSATLDFSFSGIKTAIMYDLVKRGHYDMSSKKLLTNSEELKAQVASSLLVCVKDIFVDKIKRALKAHPDVAAVSFVGGVACNKFIRAGISQLCQERGIPLFIPAPRYCTDNAAMIAFVGAYKAKRGQFDDLTLDIL